MMVEPERLAPGINASTCVNPTTVASQRPRRRMFFRCEPTDTPDKVDYQRLARIVSGLEQVIRRWPRS